LFVFSRLQRFLIADSLIRNLRNSAVERLDTYALWCSVTRGGERSSEHFGTPAELAGRIFCWWRRRRESDLVAQIVKIVQFFSLPHHANTPESKAQLYGPTEVVQN
jgi:hypothetical protein